MKKILPIIIVIMILIIMIISFLLIILLRKDESIIKEGEDIGHIDFSKVDKVTDRNEYYAIKTVLSQYYNAINYLDASIEELDVIDITSETEKENIIQQYTTRGIEILGNILDKDCINELSLNTENLLQRFKQYKNKSFMIENIHFVKKNININLYYITGLLDYEREFKLIVKTDSYTGTFSIYSQDYIEEKNYDKNSIETNFEKDQMQYIAKNDDNEYSINIITDKTMAQYYLYDYGDRVLNDRKNVYSMLDPSYKEKRFKTYNEYDEYIKESNKFYNLLELKSYSVEKKEEYNIYTCKDQYGDTYIFKEMAVMEYSIQLDDYTLNNAKFDETYQKAEDRDKGILNINKFFTMINMQDYTSAYRVLDENFKQNYFKTQADFETYMKSKVFHYNKVTYQEYSNKITDIYTYKIQLTDKTEEKQGQVEFNMVVKLLEGTNFVMSFAVN